MAMSKFTKSSAVLPPSVRERTPLIPFASKMKKMGMVDGPDADKFEWNKLEFLIDPYNTASKNSRLFIIFKYRCNVHESGSSGLWPSVRLRT
jgi:hypothetical protein